MRLETKRIHSIQGHRDYYITEEGHVFHYDEGDSTIIKPVGDYILIENDILPIDELVADAYMKPYDKEKFALVHCDGIRENHALSNLKLVSKERIFL